MLVQVDQVAQVEIVQVDLADHVQVDQVVQVEIVQVDLADHVQQVLAAALREQARLVEHQVEHQVVVQVVVLTQPVVVAILLAHLVNRVAVLQRVASQSGLSVKSLTT